jgi:ribosome-interacting GTPase 1
MGWMKHEHHERLDKRPKPYNYAAEEHAMAERRRLSELKRQKEAEREEKNESRS